MAVTTARSRRAQPERARARIDEVELRARVDALLNRRPAVGLAIGVVGRGGLEFFHGHGVADVASGTPLTEDTVFRIGSITKTMTAIGVMQLWEQGLVDLDAPANQYLRKFKLRPARAGSRPATVRHLLTHTAGVAEVRRPLDPFRPLFGEIVPAGRPVPALAEYYRDGVPVRAEPGTRFVYTDHGFTALGQLVEDVSGQALAPYLREHVFEPLGMSDTDLVRSDRVASRLATGYDVRSNGPRPVPDYELLTAGGGGVYSTTRDVGRYVAALLGGGRNRQGSVVSPATLELMFGAQYQPEPRVPGIGLAFDRHTVGGHRVVGHGGIMPGFTAQFLAAVDDGVGIVAFTNGATQAPIWLPTEVGGLLGQVLGVPEDAIRSDVPYRPEVWSGLCGWYHVPAAVTDIRTRLMLGAGAHVFVRSGRLVLRLLHPVPVAYRGFPLQPDDPSDAYAFRIDLTPFGMPTARVVFRQEPGGTTTIHTDLFPYWLERRAAAWTPGRWLASAVAALALGATASRLRRRGTRAAGEVRP